MNTVDDLVSYYGRRAREYERVYQKPERQEELAVLREAVATTFQGHRVLELACGTGYWTEVLSRSAAGVRAVDVNEETLALARLKGMDSQKVVFEIADVYALPEFRTKYTASLAAFWWSHVPKARLRDFLEGFHRVLAPGAVVMFIDNAYCERSSTPISRRDADGNTWQLRRLEDGSAHEVLKNFPDEVELRTTVSGFSGEVSIQFLRYYWTMIYTL